MTDIFKLLVNKEAEATKEMLEKIEFYHDILEDEEESKMDIQYWIDYVNNFGIGHKIPLYDHMSFIKYHNGELWGFIGLCIYIVLLVIFLVLKYSYRCLRRCICKAKPADAAKVDTKEKKE